MADSIYCNQCGTSMEAQARFCPKCGNSVTAVAVPTPSQPIAMVATASATTSPLSQPVFSQPMSSQPMSVSPPPSAIPQQYQAVPQQASYAGAAALPYAGFWMRVGAYLLDLLILVIPLTMLAFIPILGIVLNIVGVWLYFALQESSERQATIGKRALNIYVTDMYGRRISFGQATGRYFSKIISSLILGIGYIMAGFTEKKQGLHDMIAGTLVKRR
jgi:uncharacterized RDD family membrane protein YckC